MAIYGTYVGQGKYGYPGAGSFAAGQRKEISLEVALRMMGNREFQVYFEDSSELVGPEVGVGFNGTIANIFGYGSGSISILRALYKQGISTRLTPFSKRALYLPELNPEVLAQAEDRSWLPRVEINHSIPPQFKYGISPIRIGYTMWETSKLPDEAGKTNPALVQNIGAGVWQENLQACDLILVPCPFSKLAFESNGITVPIKVVPYGLDIDEWDFVERPESEVFAVLLFGDLTSRKGPLEAVQAFQRAFPNNPDVRLILKSHNGHFGIGEYGPPQLRDSRIMFIDERISRESLQKLIHTCDCFLWPSRGEGFGLPPLQAALSGLPVITTTHTGAETWFDERYFYAIETEGTSAAPYGGEWFEPSIDSAAQQLLAVYNNRKEARRKAKAANTYIRKNFSLEKFGQNLREILAPL